MIPRYAPDDMAALGYDNPNFEKAYAKVKANPSWRTFEMSCGHEVMIDMPERTAEMMTPETDRAIQAGLAWLARGQNPDGSFGTGTYRGNIAVTSLAGLAFMASGSSPGRGPYGAPIDKALAYVMDNTAPSGFIAVPGSATHGPMYSHGFGLDMLDKASCREWAARIKQLPEGFTVYKNNIHEVLHVTSGVFANTLTTAQLRDVRIGYENVREAVGDGCAVHPDLRHVQIVIDGLECNPGHRTADESLFRSVSVLVVANPAALRCAVKGVDWQIKFFPESLRHRDRERCSRRNAKSKFR